MPSQRVEQALERLAEDESLLADLDDAGARALLDWIEREITRPTKLRPLNAG